MPKKPLAQIFHFDSFGKRQEKYDNLTNTNFEDVAWKELKPTEPYYFFVPKDFGTKQKYDEGLSVNEIFKDFNSGISTDRDNLFVDFCSSILDSRIEKLLSKDFDNDFIEEFNVKNSSSYNLLDKLSKKFDRNYTKKILYRPFDYRFIYYDENIISRPGSKIMQHLLDNNLLLTCVKQGKNTSLQAIITKDIICRDTITNHTYGFPLYLYTKKEENLFSNNSEISSEGQEIKAPNFNMEIISKIEERLGIRADFIPDSVRTSFMPEDVRAGFMPTIIPTFSPENLFDYIYAILHSKNYRETYKEFLKIDFPKIPFDVSKDLFFEMAHLGEELRSYHLMGNENLIPKNFITKYEIDGDNLVEKVNFTPPKSPSTEGELGKVYINDIQYFSGVPATVWEFYIGGYQPAQKWLKDRKGRNLNYEDILHYSKIILCLKETIRIMDEIEKIFKI